MYLAGFMLKNLINQIISTNLKAAFSFAGSCSKPGFGHLFHLIPVNSAADMSLLALAGRQSLTGMSSTLLIHSEWQCTQFTVLN